MTCSSVLVPAVLSADQLSPAQAPFILKILSALHLMKTSRVYNRTDLGPVKSINLICHGHSWSSLKYKRIGCSDLRFHVSPPSL